MLILFNRIFLIILIIDAVCCHAITQTTQTSHSNEMLQKIIKLESLGVDLSTHGQDFWFLSAKLGYVDIISYLANKHIEINTLHKKEGKAALHYAAEKGLKDTVNLLLENGAFVDIKKTHCIDTPLILAAGRGHADIVSILIRNGADVYKNRLALHQAAKNGHVDIIRILIDSGYDIGATEDIFCHETALHNAIEYGQFPAVCELLRAGANPNSENILYTALINGHAKIVDTLIKHGSSTNDLNKASFYGEIDTIKLLSAVDPDCIHNSTSHPSALCYAACSGQVDVVKFLIEAGASIEGTYVNNIHPLHLASKNGHSEIVNTLLKNGADPNCYYDYKYTSGVAPLFLASGSGYSEIVKTLINSGAKIDKQARNIDLPKSEKDRLCYSTAIYNGIYHGNAEVVKLLIHSGASIAALDQGWSPLHLAAETGQNKIIEMLLDVGADINSIEEKYLWTPLHLAAKNGHLTTVQLLVACGVDTRAVDKNHRSAIKLAEENGYQEIEKYLRHLAHISPQ